MPFDRHWNFHCGCGIARSGVRDRQNRNERGAIGFTFHGEHNARNAMRLYNVYTSGAALCRCFARFAEVAMPTRFKVLAVAAALMAGTSGAMYARVYVL